MAFTTHDEYTASNKSEKILLGHIHGSKRLYNFTLDGSLYSRTTSHFVNKVFSGTTELTRVASTGAVVDNTKFFYDITTSKLYLYEWDQDTDECIVEFRFFFSNVPINLPWDLASGAEVEYEPRIITVPKFKSQMSQGKKGLNLVGKGLFKINNNDGAYDSIYDTVFFDNKDANIYSYNRDLAATESKQIFRGTITGKTFNPSDIVFSVNDTLYKLDQAIAAEQYGNEVTAEDANNHKRVIYGRADNLLCQSLDKYDGGIAITGTVSGVAGEEAITGTGTAFYDELSEGDTLIFDGFSVTVEQIKSDTLIIVSELDRTFNGKSPLLIPDVQYSAKNREFQVANHAVKKVSTTITSITSRNRIVVADASEFAAGDEISIDGEIKEIRRVSENTIVLTTNYNFDKTIGDTVSKKEIYNVRYGDSGKQINSADITINNTSAGAKFTLSDDAEINAAAAIRIKQNFAFFNGKNTVWLGNPSMYNIAGASNTSGSLYEKYFILYDEDGTSTAFWFKDTSPDDSAIYTEPTHGADNSVAVSLPSANMGTDEVVAVTIDYILRELDFLDGYVLGSNMVFQSKQSMVLTDPDEGTALFYPSIVEVGIKPLADIDLTTLIKPRDYIKSYQDGDAFYYEILSVLPTSVTLRTNYQGLDNTSYIKYKNIDYITDDTPVYVNCFGKTKNGEPTGDWIQTGAEVVEDILKTVGLGAFLDTASFTDSSIRSPQLISYVIPQTLTSAPKKAKDIINDINQSITGSLFINTDLDLGYDILDAEVALNTLETIREEDLISWSVNADGFDLSKTVIGNYKFRDYNPLIDSEDNQEVSYTSEFVGKYIGNEITNEVNLYLYNESDAQEIVERQEFINSLSNTKIKIKGKLNLSKFNLGERVLLDLNRLYVALGSTADSKTVGVITSMNNTGESVEIEVENLGSLYTRSARICDNAAVDTYADATNQEKVINSFVVGDNDIIDTDEDTFSTQLIS